MKRFKRLQYRLRMVWAGLWQGLTTPVIAGGDETAEEKAKKETETKAKAEAEEKAKAAAAAKAEGEEKPPWGSDDEFDAKRAWQLIQDTRADKEKLKKERDEHAAEVKKHQDATKSDQQKLEERATTAEAQGKQDAQDAARLRVALKKGLTETQAKRLVGENDEELEKDADELLESFKSEDEDDGQEPRRRPREKLRPGAAPGSEPEENDPAKLAEKVSRW